MQIVKKPSPIIDYSSKGTLGYFGNTKLLGFNCLENEESYTWYAIIENKKKVEHKLLKFIKIRDEYMPYKKIDIVITNTISGDLKLTEFKPLKTHSILEIIPQELLNFIDSL